MKVQRKTIRTGIPWRYPFAVEYRSTENWSTHAASTREEQALELAEKLAERYPHLPIRVCHYKHCEGAPKR